MGIVSLICTAMEHREDIYACVYIYIYIKLSTSLDVYLRLVGTPTCEHTTSSEINFSTSVSWYMDWYPHLELLASNTGCVISFHYMFHDPNPTCARWSPIGFHMFQSSSKDQPTKAIMCELTKMTKVAKMLDISAPMANKYTEHQGATVRMSCPHSFLDQKAKSTRPFLKHYVRR